MNNITIEYIFQRIHTLHQEVMQIIPEHKWDVPLTNVGMTNRKRAAGLASNKGDILINHIFVGTNLFDKLDDTIRHELAHLAAGVKHKHNHVWKRIAHAFGCDIHKTEHSEANEILTSKIQHKYWLIAITDTGERITIKSADRKAKRYTHHNPNVSRLTVDGKKIASFEYAPYKPIT